MTATNNTLDKKRVIHYAEGNFSQRNSKMTTGVIRYGFHDSVAVIDSTKAGQTCQEAIGFGGDIPVVATLEEAMAFKPEALLIGVTPPGGRLTDELKSPIYRAIEKGLDVWAGLHDFLEQDEAISSLAEQHGVSLWDIRRPARDLPIGCGDCKSMKSYIALPVGSDAAIGKMTVALEIANAGKKAGIDCRFVATGQVGIAIAGWGSPVDAIAGDFMAGAVERDALSCEGADIVLVEGQGSLYHPGFSSVTLALIHGSCPDGLILCHQPSRKSISRLKNDIPIPPLDVVAETYLNAAKPQKPTEIVCVSLNTSDISEDEALKAVQETEELLGVPATDPVRWGAEKLVKALIVHKVKVGK